MAEWVLGVGQLNEYVRRQLASDPMLKLVKVRGEISGFKRHYSGHLYFSLKDSEARVQCVMFRQSALGLSFAPKDGMQVVVTANASLFVRDGAYQLYCEDMQSEGSGELYMRFERLKARLEAEGLFDPSIKKPLPLLPRCVGVVTSKAGAALQDIIRVAHRRHPGMPIVVASAAVQGPGAAEQIAAALHRLNRERACDVILCGRGGGSIEELWAFNEEVVARAIHGSQIPVVSCVGHETDFTIADFVADVRAATPSMAAELAVPSRQELLDQLAAIGYTMRRIQTQRLALLRARLQRAQASPVLRMPKAMLLRAHHDQLRDLSRRLREAQARRLEEYKGQLALRQRALSGLNPASVLQRGYALIEAQGRVLTGAAALSSGQRVDIRMRDGRAEALVERVQLEEHHGEA